MYMLYNKYKSQIFSAVQLAVMWNHGNFDVSDTYEASDLKKKGKFPLIRILLRMHVGTSYWRPKTRKRNVNNYYT